MVFRVLSLINQDSDYSHSVIMNDQSCNSIHPQHGFSIIFEEPDPCQAPSYHEHFCTPLTMPLLTNLIPISLKTFSSLPPGTPPATLSNFNTIASYSWMEEAGTPVLAVPGKFLKVLVLLKFIKLL